MKRSLTLNLSADQSLRLERQAATQGLAPQDMLLRWIEERCPPASDAPLDLFSPAPARPERLRLPDSYAPREAAATPASVPAPVLRESPKREGWTVWSDGACSGNPGPGGWGTLVEGPAGREELSGGYRATTNNRMELSGAIAGLEHIPRGERVTVVTDSRYIVDAIEKKWLAGWKRKGWRKADGGPVANVDLWQALEGAMAGKFVRFEWVRGHNGHPENERCDQLAVAASRRPDLPPDPG